MNVGIILIIIAVVLMIPVQMILPFPYGLGFAFLLVILVIVGIVVSVKSHYKRREKFAEESLRYQADEDEPEEPKKDDKSWDGI